MSLRAGYVIHAYEYTADDGWTKVFSAHLTDVALGDRKRFNYWGGRCAILSWKRGTWEDSVCAEPDEPRSLAHVNTAGPISMLWVTGETPADLSSASDRADTPVGVPPPANGSIFRIVEFPQSGYNFASAVAALSPTRCKI